MTERDYEHERALGEYLLAKCAEDLRRSRELDARMGELLNKANEEGKPNDEGTPEAR